MLDTPDICVIQFLICQSVDYIRYSTVVEMTSVGSIDISLRTNPYRLPTMHTCDTTLILHKDGAYTHLEITTNSHMTELPYSYKDGVQSVSHNSDTLENYP